MKKRLVASLCVNAGMSSRQDSTIAPSALKSGALNGTKKIARSILKIAKRSILRTQAPSSQATKDGGKQTPSELAQSSRRGRSPIGSTSTPSRASGTNESKQSTRSACVRGKTVTAKRGAKSITPQRIVGARESRDRLAVTRARSGNSSSRSNAPNVRYAALPGSSKKTTVFRSRLAGLIWP